MNKVLAKSYARLVKAGRRTIEEVPDELRSDVEILLGADA